MNEFLQQRFLNNSLLDYLLASGGFLLASAVLWLAKRIVMGRWRKWAAKTASKVDDFILSVAERTVIPLLHFLAFYAAVRGLTLSVGVARVLTTVAAALLTFYGARFVVELIRLTVFDFYLARQGQPTEMENRFRGLMPLISVVVWVIGAVFLLDNLGFQVSAVLTGLGIGGVAVALAGSAILGDLFAYFAIMLDRPFVLGDFIVAGDYSGNVERVGIKTTRLRSLSGEQVIVANKDLTDSRIRNFKRMDQRRVLFKLGVTYDTPPGKLREVPGFIKDVLTAEQGVRFDRAHFFAFGDFSLVFEVVYIVLTPDYNQYMDIQQRVNLAIMEGFKARGVEFAFPTQTLQVAGWPKLQTTRVREEVGSGEGRG